MVGCVICQIGDFVEAVNAGVVVPLKMFFLDDEGTVVVWLCQGVGRAKERI